MDKQEPAHPAAAAPAASGTLMRAFDPLAELRHFMPWPAPSRDTQEGAGATHTGASASATESVTDANADGRQEAQLPNSAHKWR